MCIKIRDVKRILHVVPKKSNLDNAEKDNMYDLLYTEVEAKLSNLGITHRESRLMRINHVFDYLVPDVTRGNIEVVEMSFLASQHPTSIPIEAKGKTYSYIFGLDDSPITSFLLLKDIRGPKWISIVGAKHSSDCISGSCRNCSTRDGHDFECSVDDVFPIRGDNSEMPDIKVMLLIPLVMNHQTSKGFICGWINSSNITTPLNDQNINAIQYFDIDLVGTKDSKSRRCNDDFLTYISTIDPDIICGHGIADILYELIYSYKNTEQSKFSVLGRRNKVTSQTEVKDNFRLRNSTVLHYTQGRILVDSRSFSAKERAKPPFDIHVLLDFYEDKPNHHTILKAYTSYINKSSILGTTYYFSKKVGNTWTDNLWSPSSFREEFLLHRIYYRSACLIPNKRKYTKQDEKVTGGFNEKPKSGIFTTYTALLDYEAYYPTIICENELCFSTVDKDMIKSEIVTHSTETKKMTLEPILPKELRTFIQDRKYLKGLLANPELPPDEQASTKSLANALKLCVNGLYGCFNLPSFRFYNPKFASFITKEGQKRIKDTIKFVKEDLQKQILFASTDSILVDTNTNILNEANSIADKICEVMNSGTNDIKLKVECFFKPCMVHSAMNKYIGKKILITEEEIKTDLVTKPKLDPLGCPPVVTSIVKDSINKFLHFIENNKVIIMIGKKY